MYRSLVFIVSTYVAWFIVVTCSVAAVQEAEGCDGCSTSSEMAVEVCAAEQQSKNKFKIPMLNEGRIPSLNEDQIMSLRVHMFELGQQIEKDPSKLHDNDMNWDFWKQECKAHVAQYKPEMPSHEAVQKATGKPFQNQHKNHIMMAPVWCEPFMLMNHQLGNNVKPINLSPRSDWPLHFQYTVFIDEEGFFTNGKFYNGPGASSLQLPANSAAPSWDEIVSGKMAAAQCGVTGWNENMMRNTVSENVKALSWEYVANLEKAIVMGTHSDLILLQEKLKKDHLRQGFRDIWGSDFWEWPAGQRMDLMPKDKKGIKNVLAFLDMGDLAYKSMTAHAGTMDIGTTMNLMPWWSCRLHGKQCNKVPSVFDSPLKGTARVLEDVFKRWLNNSKRPETAKLDCMNKTHVEFLKLQDDLHLCAMYHRNNGALNVAKAPYYVYAVLDPEGRPLQPFWDDFLKASKDNGHVYSYMQTQSNDLWKSAS